MLKLIYLARRKPGFSHDDFIRRWRMHGAKGMATPFWQHALGYVQAEAILPTLVPGASETYDAVACMMVREAAFAAVSPEDAAAAQADTQMMLADELETFSGPVMPDSLWVKEEVLIPGPLGGITGFLFFTDAAQARRVAEQYSNAAGLHRLILNLKDDALGAVPASLRFQAVVELSAISLPALQAALETAPVSAADVAVVTREAVLWDRMPA